MLAGSDLSSSDVGQGNADIDIDAEIKRAEEKLTVLNLNADKLKAVQAKPDYEKTPVAVREANDEKVRLPIQLMGDVTDP